MNWQEYTLTIENTLDFQRRTRIIRAISQKDAEWVATHKCKRNPNGNIIPDGWHAVELSLARPPLPMPKPFNHSRSPEARRHMRETGATLPPFPEGN